MFIGERLVWLVTAALIDRKFSSRAKWTFWLHEFDVLVQEKDVLV